MLKSLSPVSSAIGVAVSHMTDADAVAKDMARQLDGDEIAFLLVFPHDALDLDTLAASLTAEFDGVPVFGCSTAGQITPAGYENEAALGIAFLKRHFSCHPMLISPLNPLSIETISTSARALANRVPKTAKRSRLALVFADGLSKQEDLLAATLVAALEDVPVFGGSAGDGLKFRETSVLCGGRFHHNAALVLLLETDLDFVGLGFDHFLPTDTQMVVTGAIPEERVVLEINGSPAAEEYARLVGCAVSDLSPTIFAENPLLVRHNAIYHVRAIYEVQDGNSLSFFSAIEDGLVLTLGRGIEILRTLEDGLDVRDGKGRRASFILGFDCFLRKLEIAQKQLTVAASSIMSRSRVLGFNTYGEQHYGVHVSQTFVGVAFFDPADGPGR